MWCVLEADLSLFYKAFDKDHMKRLKKQGLYKRKMEDKTPLLSLEEVENGAFLEKSFDLQSEFIDILKDILETYHYDLGSYELPWRFLLQITPLLNVSMSWH